MATHDYVIDNQSAPSLRSDLNNALQAIVTQNSNATAPTTTYANMLWYDTTNNQIKKRNEANSAWVTLGTINETLGTFTPSGTPAIATQAEAEAGTDNTKLMTPLRVEQHMTANALGWGQTWQNVTGSRAQNTSYQNTTGRPIQLAVLNRGSGGTRFQVSSDNATWIDVAYATSGGLQYNTSFVVPNNWYYRANTTTMTIDSWAELR